MDYAEEMKITASTCLFLNYNCVGEAPKIQAVLSSIFHDGNDIAGGSNRGGGWG